MKHLVIAGLMALALAGCGGGSSSSEETGSAAASATTEAAPSETAAESGCTASGLDAMSTLADFQLEMNDAKKAGKLTIDQLTASRDKLFNQTQEAQKTDDWGAYCKAIDDLRAELGL